MLGALLGSIGVPVSPPPPVIHPPVAYTAIMPELILLGGALALLVLASLTSRRIAPMLHAAFTVAVSLAAMGWTMIVLWPRVTGQGSGPHGPFTALSGAVVVDGFTLVVFVLVEASIILGVLVGAAWCEREQVMGPELCVLAMFSGAGAMLMATANDLIVVFLGLEILSIPLYILAGLNSRRQDSGEAAMKYFILGAFSSAIFIYGVALTYGATGTTNLAHIAAFLGSNVLSANGLLLAGMALLLVGFGFKIAAVPFHAWAPDVYQGSPSPITGYMAAVAKAGGFAALLRVFFSGFAGLRLDWQPAIWLLAVLTLVVGAVLAVMQSDIKRMMAYSSISHAGFVLVGLYAASSRGIAGSLYYLFTYSFMVVGTFAVVTMVGGRGDGAHRAEDYRGLAGRSPLLAGGLTILLIAQAGIPFTTGFLAKFYVIAAAVASGQYVIAVIAMVAAVIASFAYLRVVVTMYAAASIPAGVGGQLQPAMAGSPGHALEAATPRRRVGPSLLATLAAGAGPRTSGGISGDYAEDEPEAAARPDRARPPRLVVPAAVWAALAVAVLVTVGFGVYPAPAVDFARSAILAF